MRNVVYYLVIVLVTVYVEIMYREFCGITLLSFELLLFAAMLVMSRYFRRMVSAGLSVRLPAAGKDEEIRVSLTIRNRGFLPVTKLRFWIAAENLSTSRRVKLPVTGSVAARREERVMCSAYGDYCGRYRLFVEKARVCDYLGLLSWKIPCVEETYVDVLPGFYEMEIRVSERTRNFPVDGEEYDPHRSGDDPSEIFQIREFRDGDTLQRVHWKLSAKADELMTKELGRPVGYRVLVLVDLYMDPDAKESAERMDMVMELTAALSFSLQRTGVQHLVVWYDEKQGILCRMPVSREEQVYEMTDRLLGAGTGTKRTDLWEDYREMYPGEGFSTVLRLDTKPGLSVNDRKETVFDTGRPKEQISGFLLEV